MSPIKVVSQAELEMCDYVVCMPVGLSSFEDNLTGSCCECGQKIMYHWHAPRKPKKICLACMKIRLDAEGEELE